MVQLGLIGLHSRSALFALGDIIIATPNLCMLSSLPEKIMLSPVFSSVLPKPVHLTSLRPWHLVLPIARATCAALPMEYIDLTFQHPM